MTRSYFEEYVNDWCDLISLCYDENCDICYDIIDDDELDERVDHDVRGTDLEWRRLRNYLCDIPTGYEYYRIDGSFDYVGMDESDFEDYKNMVKDWMDHNDRWDGEDDEEEEEEDGVYCSDPSLISIESEDPPVEEEDFSVSELMSLCTANLAAIRMDAVQR